jgi:ABC-type branched-subunit amino acid transport system ATPase component
MLKLQGITKTFGGITALKDVSFDAGDGLITGVIGPNGAGKTTLFNIATGLYTQDKGQVYLGEQNISLLPPERLARLGVVRTFQNLELFGQMTVLENVMVGLHTKSTSGFLSCALKLPRQIREEKNIRDRAAHWLDYTGISDFSGMAASNLPFGKGRLLEISRALALEPQFILMDEPAAGLNTRETMGLADIIRKIKSSGITVVLVEHDMEFVMDICDTIVVLNLGQTLAQGPPQAIQENPEVIAAYLGVD